MCAGADTPFADLEFSAKMRWTASVKMRHFPETPSAQSVAKNGLVAPSRLPDQCHCGGFRPGAAGSHPPRGTQSVLKIVWARTRFGLRFTTVLGPLLLAQQVIDFRRKLDQPLGIVFYRGLSAKGFNFGRKRHLPAHTKPARRTHEAPKSAILRFFALCSPTNISKLPASLEGQPEPWLSDLSRGLQRCLVESRSIWRSFSPR